MIFTKISDGIKDFIKGLKIIFGKPEPGKGNRQLAKMSKLAVAQIPVYGKQAVRAQIIKSIEKDMKRYAKRGGKTKIDKEISEAIATPEYMTLLRKVGLEESHLRVTAMEAIKKHAN